MEKRTRTGTGTRERKKRGGMRAVDARLDGYGRWRRMLGAPCTVDALSENSAYGFVYRLRLLRPEDAQYARWTREGDVPATTMVVKCVPLTPGAATNAPEFVEHRTPVVLRQDWDLRRNVYRWTMQWEQLLEEAAAQQRVWLNTMSPEPLCPAVADVFRVDGAEAEALCAMLRRSAVGAEGPDLMLLMSRSIGVIVMDVVDNAVTLEEIPDRTRYYVLAVVLLIAMYLEAKLIHADLHRGNVMIQDDPEVHAIALDFGRFLVVDGDEQLSAWTMNNMTLGTDDARVWLTRVLHDVNSAHARRYVADMGGVEAAAGAIVQRLIQRSDSYNATPDRAGLVVLPDLSPTRRRVQHEKMFSSDTTFLKRALSPASSPSSSPSHHRLRAEPMNNETIRQALLALAEDDDDEDIGGWDMSEVTNMDELFAGRRVPASVGRWSATRMTSMVGTFAGATFDDPDMSLNSWFVDDVEDMTRTFAGSNFRGDISEWYTAHVRCMDGMFLDARDFAADLSEWDVDNVISADRAFEGCPAVPPVGLPASTTGGRAKKRRKKKTTKRIRCRRRARRRTTRAG